MDAGDSAARKMMIMRCSGGVGGGGGGGGDVFYNKAIMMRFRPIAPKPVTGDSVPGGSSVDGKKTSISKEKTKRKYVRVRRYNRKRKFNDQNNTAVTTTLQLLPEKHDGGGYPPPENQSETRKEAVVKSSDRRGEGEGGELWVTVESVTDTCMEEEEEEEDECTDEERKKNLEEDTCPGFITDGLNKVEWLNEGFKRMVRQKQKQRNNNDDGSEIEVWFLSKQRMENMSSTSSRRIRSFTCQIKLQYKWGKEKEMEKDSKRVPCDVWRMETGGFAWKLDVKTALTLGPHF